jgi:hypothetical protein
MRILHTCTWTPGPVLVAVRDATALEAKEGGTYEAAGPLIWTPAAVLEPVLEKDHLRQRQITSS